MDKLLILTELERIFNFLNQRLFNGEIKPVSIAVQAKKKCSLRYFSEEKILNIGSEFGNLQHQDILGVMLHEMIHIYNEQKDMIDVTANQYHNKYFLTMALQAGLVVIKHKSQGWSITSTLYPRNVIDREYIKKPTREAIQRRIEVFDSINLDKQAYKQIKNDLLAKVKKEKPAKVFFLKYVCNCPPPHNSIRSGRRPDGPNALNITCNNCRSKFECVDP